MLHTSARMANAALDPSVDTERLEAAYDALLASQCNDPYWHGVFGGAYLTNLRHATFSSLVRADGLLEKIEGFDGVRLKHADIDCDSFEELLIETQKFTLFVKPSTGGMISELDFKPCNFNVMNSISRQEEAYHHKITRAADTEGATGTKSIHDIVETKEAGLEKLLIYDWYRHGCLVDHILAEGTTLEEMQQMKFGEIGDFVTSPFEWGWKKSGTLDLVRTGSVWQHGAAQPLKLTKSLHVTDGGNDLTVEFQLENLSETTLRFAFGSEWLFNLLAGNAHDRYYESDGEKLPEATMNSAGTLEGRSNIRLVDEFLRTAIGIEAEGADSLWRMPLESVSLSEAGFERVFQGSLVLPLWHVELDPNEKWEGRMRVRFDELS
jgi:alpha-amylase